MKIDYLERIEYKVVINDSEHFINNNFTIIDNNDLRIYENEETYDLMVRESLAAFHTGKIFDLRIEINESLTFDLILTYQPWMGTKVNSQEHPEYFV